MIIANLLDDHCRCVDLCALSQNNHHLYAIVTKELDRHLCHTFSQGLENTILEWSAVNGKEDSVNRVLKAGTRIQDLSEHHDGTPWSLIHVAARD
jgi:hypothetical protein